MKYLIIIAMLSLLAISVASVSVYEQTPTGFHIYEDFTSYNASRHQLAPNCVFASNQLRCTDGDGMFFTHPDFRMNPRGAWVMEVRIAQSGANAIGSWFIKNNNVTPERDANSTNKWLGFFHRNRVYDYAGTLAYWIQNGTTQYLGDNGWSVGNGDGLDDANTWTYNHTVNYNGTGTASFYELGVFQESYTSPFALSCNVEDSDDYYLMFNARVGSTFHEVYIDWFNLTYTNPDNITVCEPAFSCGGYGSCNITNNASCTSATDSNSCGLGFGTCGELLSDFPDQACDYCDDSVTIQSTSACVNDSENVTYIDANFGTCCNVTGFANDCGFDTVRNSSTFVVSQSCGTFDYDEGDISLAVIDTAVKFIFNWSLFVMLIVVIFIVTTKSVQELWKKYLR